MKEQALNLPVPIFVELEGESEGARVELHYRPASGKRKKWRRRKLKPLGEDFGSVIPCRGVRKQALVEYYIVVKQGDTEVAHSGSKDKPHVVAFVETVPEPLSLPGKDPPRACKKKRKKHKRVAEPPKTTRRKKRKRLWLVIGLSQDLTVLGGTDVCTGAGQEDGFYCFREDGSQYAGNPVKGRYDEISTGFAPSATRLLAGLDYVIGKATLGARAGYTLRGSSPTPVGGGDFPFLFAAHGEYWFAKHAYRTSRFGAYLLGELGVAEADAKRERVPIEEDRNQASNQANPDRQYVEVWKRAGRGFLSLGAGAFVPVGKSGGVVIEVPFRLYLPASAFGVAPTLGYAAGF